MLLDTIPLQSFIQVVHKKGEWRALTCQIPQRNNFPFSTAWLTGFAPKKVSKGGGNYILVTKHFQMNLKPPQGWNSHSHTTYESTKNPENARTIIFFSSPKIVSNSS